MSATIGYDTGYYHQYRSEASDASEAWQDATGLYTPSMTPDTPLSSRNNSYAGTQTTQYPARSQVPASRPSSIQSGGKTKPTKSKGKAPADDVVPTTRKKSRKTKDEPSSPLAGPSRASSEDMDDSVDTFDDSKRHKFLERNRVAASKCRQRKKEWVSGLEETKYGLESTNSHLHLEYRGLLGEVSRMKNELMNHASCHDPNIDKWIDNEARRFVESTGDHYVFTQPGYGAYTMPPASYQTSTYQGPLPDGTSMMPPFHPSFPPQQ